MPRRRVADKRKIHKDPKYKSELVTQFINRVMKHGKKSVAEGIVYGAFDILVERQSTRGSQHHKTHTENTGSQSETPALDIFVKAIDNAGPDVEIRPRRVGGSTYQIPVEVRSSRRKTLAMAWIIEGANLQSGGKSMSERLAGEILEASEGKGNAIRKREEVHRMAKANQAFAHFRWNN